MVGAKLWRQVHMHVLHRRLDILGDSRAVNLLFTLLNLQLFLLGTHLLLYHVLLLLTLENAERDAGMPHRLGHLAAVEHGRSGARP